MEVLRLETACIRHVALWPSRYFFNFKKLPPSLKKRVIRLCEDVDLFIRLHSRILHIQRSCIIIDGNCEIDWAQTFRHCINAADPDQAFKFAAVNALEEECLRIWQNLGDEGKKKLQKSSNAVIRSAAWHAAGFHYLVFYDHVCCIAARNGWPNALRLWLSRVPDDEYARLCARLSLIAICHEHYHLLEILPDSDNFPFTFIFPRGCINSNFVRKLANTPPRWKHLTVKIARSLLDWGSRKDVDRIRLEFYSNIETAVYGRFIDLLLTQCNELS